MYHAFQEIQIPIVLARKLRDKGIYILFENAGFSTNDKIIWSYD